MADKTKRQFSQATLSDLSMLDSVSEDRILGVLKNRYKDDDIYTNIGPVLIAINPFKNMRHLTTEARIREYRGKKYFEMPPHPYALIDDAYSSMITYHENHCVIISGESGKGTGVQIVKDRMLSSNPILESFGNAKTINNNNSSRFGKYMLLNFDLGGDPVGGSVQQYLLEKSRVVGPSLNERNFHIFYQLTTSLTEEQKQAFYVENSSYYRYLASSGCFDVPGIDDRQEWKDVCQAFKCIGLSQPEQDEIIRVLSTVLWLGNVDFTEDAKEQSSPTDSQVIAIIAHLLQVTPEVVTTGLCIRTITAGAKNEIFKKPCRREEAEFNRDTLAKAMYSKVFDYLVDKINISIVPPSTNDECIIGILDIFGFEIFQINSFEQLCINFVNEKLQQIFIELTIKNEQEEYHKEGISWTTIPYFDNKPLCDLIEARPGILSVLDDTCATNKDERSFVQTLGQMFAKVDRLQCGQMDFTIQHYAGAVRYDATGFTVKNKDTLFNDLVIILQTSKCRFAQDHGWNAINTAPSQGARPPTVSKVFNQQVQMLMKALMSCVPHYVRCIKPNHRKSPNDFDTDMIQRQVQYLGLLENVRVRRAGYAYRAPFERFARRYGVLSEEVVTTHKNLDDRSKTVKLCQYLGWSEKNQYSMGQTKVFIREASVLFNLEELLERKIGSAVTIIQNAYRNYLLKRRYLELKAAGYDALKMANKERRRVSVSGIDYRGDYLNLRQNQPAQMLLQKSGQKEDILFADRGFFVNVREKKGFFGSMFGPKENDLENRLFVVTSLAWYCFTLEYCPPAKQTPETRGNYNVNGVAAKLYWRATWDQLKSINLSPYSDGYMVVHMQDSTNIRPQFIYLLRKTECLAAVYWCYDQKNQKPPINRAESDSILVNAKKQSYVQISWMRDTMVGDSSAVLTKDKKEKQNFVVQCGPAAQFSECPEPYRPAKVDYTSGGRSVLRATKTITKVDDDELGVTTGQTLYVVRDAENGWYQCEDQQGNVGWVPQDAVTLVSQAGNATARQQQAPKMGMGQHAPQAPPQPQQSKFGGPPPPTTGLNRPQPGANMGGPRPPMAPGGGPPQMNMGGPGARPPMGGAPPMGAPRPPMGGGAAPPAPPRW